MAEGANQKRGSIRKSITVKDPPAEVASGGKRQSISVEKSKAGKGEDGKGDTLPGNLAGKLQSLFTQTEKAEAPALKPLRRPKVVQLIINYLLVFNLYFLHTFFYMIYKKQICNYYFGS
ncbi:unnamed protein product [Orchesella dallaii]|uniref:Uncharacterized protein n=1 Tax=Orchesella dallaii TaxID=48710 RepID=A0ABP1RDF7_9HEXA